MGSPETPGQIAYQAWWRGMGHWGRAPWEELLEKTQAAWEAVATAVLATSADTSPQGTSAP